MLAPGQRLRADPPPFGLLWFAHRMPDGTAPVAVRVSGVVDAPFELTAPDLENVGRRDQATDFHCVTTWSYAARWSGVPFADVYEMLIRPRLRDGAEVRRVLFKGADGFRDALELEDALAPGNLLADRLDGAPLSRGNGAPLRLVAPAHYGYKNVKYLSEIVLLDTPNRHRFSLHHPRARVAHEERFLGLPAGAVRGVYRRARPVTAWWFRRMMQR